MKELKKTKKQTKKKQKTMKMMVTSIVIEVLGRVPKGMEKRLGEVETRRRMVSI